MLKGMEMDRPPMCYIRCILQIHRTRNTVNQYIWNTSLRYVKKDLLLLTKALSLLYNSPQRRFAMTLERLLIGVYLHFLIV